MSRHVAVVGAGPAGLMAAEIIASAGHAVAVYDRMASPARKFQLAGRGGLNLTHSEALPAFLARYGAAQAWLAPAISAFSPQDLRDWCAGLGEETFVGSSGRVFPVSFKAAPLLRAWLRKLAAMGVSFAGSHAWQGWDDTGALLFATAQGAVRVPADAVVLALGGASWPRLGADGSWLSVLAQRGVEIAPLRPANCGVNIAWSEVLRAKCAGAPLKRIALSINGQRSTGEAMITGYGLEGGAVYALGPAIRAALDAQGEACLLLDLRPDLPAEKLAQLLDGARGGRSLSKFLAEYGGLSAPAVALVQEAVHGGGIPGKLSELVKAIPLRITGMQGLARAISAAGGITRAAVDEHYMLKALPGIFVAGEMLDWEAPTGGYLLQACFATGVAAGWGVANWLRA